MASRRQRQRKAKKIRAKKMLVLPGKWLRVASFLLLLLLCAAFFGGYFKIRQFLKSDDFRVLVEERSGDKLEAVVEISPIQWQGWTAKSEGLEIRDTNSVEVLRIDGLEASLDVSSVLDGQYHLRNFQIDEVSFQRDLTQRKGDPPPKHQREKSFIGRFLPKNYLVSHGEVSRLHGGVKTPSGEWMWDEGLMQMTSGQGEGVYDFKITGAKLHTPLDFLPKVVLREGQFRMAEDQVFLLNSLVTSLGNSRLELAGNFSLEDKKWKLKGELSDLDCAELIAENWKKRLTGILRSSFTGKGYPGLPVALEGSLELEQGVLTALPVLDRIADYTGALRFRRLVLSEASLDYRVKDSLIELSNIRLASEGLVQVLGGMVIRDRVIERGEFRLGVTPGTLSRIPGAEAQVFHRGERGLLWTTVRVSGTLDEPKEDLSDRLLSAAGRRMFEKATETGGAVLKFGADTVEGVLDGDGASLPDKIISKGTDTLFNLLGGSSKKEE